jgi:hypothetical protein
MVRSALALRAEENQVFVAASFLLGPDYLSREKSQDFYGQSALLAPMSLTDAGDGILIQAGTNRTEGLIAADLDAEGLYALRQTSRFRPRQEMNLGNLGPVLAEMYQQGLTIDQAVERRSAGPSPLEEAALEPSGGPVVLPEVVVEPDYEPVEAPAEEEPPSAVALVADEAEKEE